MSVHSFIQQRSVGHIIYKQDMKIKRHGGMAPVLI